MKCYYNEVKKYDNVISFLLIINVTFLKTFDVILYVLS